MKKERRDFKRVPAAAVLEISRVEHRDGTAEGGRSMAESLELSPTGMLFSTDMPLAVGDRVRVRIDIDSAADARIRLKKDADPPAGTVEVLGEVVRVKGAAEIGFDVALRFTSVVSGDMRNLECLIASRFEDDEEV